MKTLCVLAASAIIFCGGALAQPQFTDDLRAASETPDELQKLLDEGSAKPVTEEVLADMAKLISRQKIVRQAAYSYGVQSGLHWRYQQIMAMLDRDAQLLDTIFDYSKFLVDGRMLMPVVQKSERIYQQSSDGSARSVDVSYTLERPARLVPTAPSWRASITSHVDGPVAPDRALYPRTPEEESIWEDAVSSGWESGIDQANDIFKIEMRRLTAEIMGMYLFRELVVQGIVTMPKVASSQYSIMRLEDGKKMHVDDVITTITESSAFTSSSSWSPVFREEAR